MGRLPRLAALLISGAAALLLLTAVTADAGAAESAAAAGSDDAAPASLARRIWLFLGVFHPMVVHFPIALLTVAAMVELGRAMRLINISRDVTWICLLLGATTAVLAALLGWANAAYLSESTTLATHRWVGVTMTVLAVGLAAVTTWQRYRQQITPGRVYLAAMLLLAVGVGFTGHQGGKLVYGDDYIDRAWRNLVSNGGSPSGAVTRIINKEDRLPLPDLDNPEASVDFASHVWPILEANCIDCHGPDKRDGRLRLHTEADAITGGRGGPAYEPGDPEHSLLFELVTSPFEDERMPPVDHANPLDEQEIAILRRWIEQGARWNEPSYEPRP